METGGAGDGASTVGKEAAGRPLTAEEEAVKRNTDCVYFLASPLTCKKGTECEYRHSEGARVNPRDCWYWSNGNCLNPKCSFRHPPLDGMLGISGTTLVPAPPSQTVTATKIPALHAPPYNLNKQNVPCYYFQKGQCLKGDRCSFMHGPHPTETPVPQQMVKVSASVTEPRQTLKEELRGLKECITQRNIPIPKANIEKPVAVLPSFVKPAAKTESMPNNSLAPKRSMSPYPLENELPRSQPTNVPVSSCVDVSLPWSHQSYPVDERLQNGRNADEFLRESSPGFDVLVDDSIEDSDYHHNEDGFGRESGQGGRSLYPITDFNYHHSEYDHVHSFERDQYNEVDEYDRHGRIRGSYGREQQRTSSERIKDRQLMPERRVRSREESPEKMDGSDLRHRLLKQRRLGGSRSAVSPDHRREPHRKEDRYSKEDRYHGRHSHRDQQHFPQESSISTRLQGRIKLPLRSSPDQSVELRPDRERDRGRHRGRLSPAKPTNYHGRNHEKMKRRSHEDFVADARNLRSQTIRRDNGDPLNFAGPKSLAELKGAKASENFQDKLTKNINARFYSDQKSMKSAKAVGCEKPVDSVSFEGPKVLSGMKREGETAHGNGATPSNSNENNHRDGEVVLGSSASAAALDIQFMGSSESVKEGYHDTHSMEESRVGAVEEEEEGLIPEAGEDGQFPAKEEMEEGMIMDTVEEREVEISEQRNEESDYEAVDNREKAEDDEHIYHDDEEELDDDDDDDFARKVGVMFS